jgi:hypothetical protein
VSEPVRVGVPLAQLQARLEEVHARAREAGRVPEPLYRCLTCLDTGLEDLGECITVAGNAVRRGLRPCPAGCKPSAARVIHEVPPSERNEF